MCDSLIYTFINNKYTLYKVMSIDANTNTVTCYKHGMYKCTFNEVPHLNWTKIGVFKRGGVSELDMETISRKDIAGKVLHVNQFLLTCPNNVLQEK